MKIGRNNLMPPNSITSPDGSRRPALVGTQGADVQRRPLFYWEDPRGRVGPGRV